MFVVHCGFGLRRWLMSPAASMLMSPVVELTVSRGTCTSSPIPLKEAAIDKVLLNDDSPGKRQAMSARVMAEGAMLPLYLSDGITKWSPRNR